MPKRNEPTIGWRFWCVTRGEKPPRLHSPYGPAPEVTGATVHAECSRNHKPPAVDCECGIYAIEHVIDACYRYHVILAHLNSGTKSMWSVVPRADPARTVPVLARVHLHDVRWLDTRPGSPYRCITPEMRAARATIERLYIFPARPKLAARLAAAMNVPVVCGFPSYNRDDWETLPAWYRRGGPRAALGVYDEYEPLTRDGLVIPFTGVKPQPGEVVCGSHTAHR